MQLVSVPLCSLLSTWSSRPAAPFWLGKGLSGYGFLPCRSELSRWWISEARSSHVHARCEHFPSSVCGSSVRQAALLTWQVEVVWDWSAVWCRGGEEPRQLLEQPLLLGEGARWARHCSSAHLPPTPAQMQHLFPSTSLAQAAHGGAELGE